MRSNARKRKREEEELVDENNADHLLSSVPLLAMYHYNRGGNSHERFLAAFLCIDVEGFTKFVYECSNQPAEAVATANNFFGNIITRIRKHNGDIVKFTGDGFQVVWRCCVDLRTEANDSVTDEDWMRLAKKRAIWNALSCAIELTTADDLGTFVIRAGLGFGEILGMITHYQFGLGNTAQHRAAKEDQKIRKEYFILGETVDEGNKCEKAYKNHRVNGGQCGGVVTTLMFHKEFHHEFPDIEYTGFSFNLKENRTNNLRVRETRRGRKEFYFYNSIAQVTKENIYSTTVEEEKTARCIGTDARKFLSPFIHEMLRSRENESIYRYSPAFSVCVFICLHFGVAHRKSKNVTFDSYGFIDRTNTENGRDSELHVVFTICFRIISKSLRENDGLLRQFIQDDKGIVAICTFGGETEAIVAENSANATQQLQSKIHGSSMDGTFSDRGVTISTSIGMSLDKDQMMWFGLVGPSNIRQEFIVFGLPVLIAARLMALEGSTNEIRCHNFSNSLCGFFKEERFSNEGEKIENLKVIGRTKYQLFRLR